MAAAPSSSVRVRRALVGLSVFVGLFGALAFIVTEPSLRAAQADWRTMALTELAPRVARFHQTAGRWPQRLEDLAPPSCRGETCLLDETALQNVRHAELRVIAAEGLLLCLDGECRFVGPDG